MSSGDDRIGPEGPKDKTSNSNNLNTVTKYNIYTGFVLPQYRNDPDVIAALGRMPSAARTTATRGGEEHNNNSNTPRTMGTQSQLRTGSIHTCKKKATTKHKFVRRKEIQLAIGGGEAFVEVKHCLICKLENDNFVVGYEKVRVPKSTYHPRCHRNGEFKAKSRRSV
jgi:hypothetical protein